MGWILRQERSGLNQRCRAGHGVDNAHESECKS